MATLLRVASAADALVDTPMTMVGMPAAAAAVTAATVPGESSAAESELPGMQFGRPSVTSSRNLGLGSVRPPRYAAPAFSARRVGVRLPLVTPPFALVRPNSAFWMAPALPAPTSTATLLPTPQVASVSAKNFRPHWMESWVSATTALIAGVTCAHFEVAPQPLLLQALSVMSLFIDPDASR